MFKPFLNIFTLTSLLVVSCGDRYIPNNDDFLPNKEKQVTENDTWISMPEHNNAVIYFSVPLMIPFLNKSK